MMKSTMLSAAIAAALLSSTANAENLAIGIGAGIPYGGITGANISYQVADHVDALGALGLSLDGLAWEVGGRAYLSAAQEKHKDWRLTAVYGTNAVIETKVCSWWDCESEYESFNGLTLGVGWGTRAGYRGWNFDLLYIVTTGADDRADELRDEGYEVDKQSNGLALSFGYQWGL
ncbi:hypothetical protein [Oceanobacter mangrovi]|uniref:hypothetical protein n=1 Tax=Oceanobacter mangrovi TaxID=2862510 RepID=UPI001C8D6DAD|nr:hypothetical protein [Oceanobacter mangrovi]